jgi:hypothetical protein
MQFEVTSSVNERKATSRHNASVLHHQPAVLLHAPDILRAGLTPEFREQKSLEITEMISLVTGR